jgi:hypothetical protein
MPIATGIYRLHLLIRSNWISTIGAIVTTFAFMGIILMLILSTFGGFGGPYLGIVTFLVLPVIFVFGLLAIPIGLVVYRSRLAERIEVLKDKPLRLVRTVLLLTAVNILIVATAGYQGVHYMDSPEFCGLVCHQVMAPQYNAYLESPHARVQCVQCHIGPGASWFVKAKLDGMRQIIAVALDTYERPIPTPVHSLRPARETCEQCHWPDQFTGDRVVVRRHFREDRDNSPYTNVLMLKTGGTRPDGEPTGIHWHMHSGIEVRYKATDERRENIPWVKLVDHNTGREEVFMTEGIEEAELADIPERVMDCVDCHNQPSHKFEIKEFAVDEAMTEGRISPRLPFIKREAVKLLDGQWSREEAPAKIRESLTGFYAEQEKLPDDLKALVGPAADELTKIWLRNIYPDMKIGWQTYNRFLRHEGCKRCHEAKHFSPAGNMIPVDCSVCHVLLSDSVPNPPVLEKLKMNRPDRR